MGRLVDRLVGGLVGSAGNELTGDDKSSCCNIVHYLVKTVMLAITTHCITSYLGINIQVSYLDLIQ